jgi:C-terminal processing protease CtpA/Prc
MEIMMEGMGEAMAGLAPPRDAKPPEAEALPALGGATVRLVPEGEKTLLELVLVPEASLAANTGLATGDRIVGIDGKPVTREEAARAAGAFGKPGKLSLDVRRKDGSIEAFEIEFVKEGGR